MKEPFILVKFILHSSVHCCCIVVKKTPRCPYGTVSSPSGCLHFPPPSNSENSEYAKATWQTANLKCEHESGFLGQLATPTNMEDLYSLNALRNMYGKCCFQCHASIQRAWSWVESPSHYFLISSNQPIVLKTDFWTANQILTLCCMSVVGNIQYIKIQLKY